MIRNPIQNVTNKLQYRAIGIVYGIYNPHNKNLLNRGTLTDNEGRKIETVVLGKALSLIKKHTNTKNSYFWIVYPKNKNSQNLHLQIVGLWDPLRLNNIENDNSKKDTFDLLRDFNLKDNYFSIRGDLIYVNTQKKEFVIKVCSTTQGKKLKNNNFKLVVEGDLSIDFLNNFVSLDVIRDGSTLKMFNYEIIEKSLPKK